MRYHYKKRDFDVTAYGELYICDHPVYSRCTLFKMRDKGLAVIQQRYDAKTKTTWWGEIDSWLCIDLYTQERFLSYFQERAGECKDGLYPTVTIRQMMWALRMKPLQKERWETVFDRKDI